MTTKIHAAVDALGLPIRFVLTPGQKGGCQQARGLIAGLKSVGHGIADAAYDADYWRAFITEELGATPQIKQNPTRASIQPLDREVYKERHLVKCFSTSAARNDQAFPQDRPAMRKDRSSLPSLRLNRLHYALARLNEDAP